jgi:hypothetical protein
MTNSGAFNERIKFLKFERKNHTHDKPKPIARAVPAEQTQQYENPTGHEETEKIDWLHIIKEISPKAIPIIAIIILGLIFQFASGFEFGFNNVDDFDDAQDGFDNRISTIVEYTDAKAEMSLSYPDWIVEYKEDTFGQDNYYVNYEKDEALYVCGDFTLSDETAGQIDNEQQVETDLADAKIGTILMESTFSSPTDNYDEKGYYFYLSDVYVYDSFKFEITPETYEVSETDNTFIATCDYTVTDYPDIFGSIYLIKEKSEPHYVFLYTEIKDPLSSEYLKADLVALIQDNIIWYE